MVRAIQVVEHELSWAAAFEVEAIALSHVFGDFVVAIHHIGSASVRALSAKPIVDMLVVLRETSTNRSGRFYFSKDTAGVRTHHVHTCAEGHPQVFDLLAMRDYLRSHPERAGQYGALKRNLAVGHRDDNVSYTRGKDTFVKAFIEEARAWVDSSLRACGP